MFMRQHPGGAARPHRKGWASAAALIATVVAGAVGAVGPVAAQAPPVRFVTLNVLHGGPMSGWTGNDSHLEARLALVSEALLGLGPDVVALQEASWTRGRGEVASRLAQRLGMHRVYAPASMRLFDMVWPNQLGRLLLNFSEGPAILSRFPIARSETHRLPPCGWRMEPRVLLFVELDTPAGRLPVFSTHTRGNPCHTRAVAGLVHSRRADLPGVLMGDLNAVESSEAITALTRESGFVDAFRAKHPDATGATVWQPVTASERRAFRRVDYVLLVPGRAFPGLVVDSRVVVDVPGRLPDGTTLWPSDHYGVLADLVVSPPGPTDGTTGRGAAQHGGEPSPAPSEGVPPSDAPRQP